MKVNFNLIAKITSFIFLVLIFQNLNAAEDNDWKSPESIAERKARWMYDKYLDGLMNVPAFYPQSLTFRVQNNINQTSQKDGLEFYLLAYGGRSGEALVIYPSKISIYNQLYRYFLKYPKAGFDSFDFKPDVVKKEIPYSDCQDLKEAIDKANNYVKSSLMSDVAQGQLETIYSLGYTDFNFKVLYQSGNVKEQPFVQLLQIEKMAKDCAEKLPTVEEKIKLDEIERRNNYKGKIFDYPPSIVLQVGSKKYESLIGTFCWPIDTQSICSDSFATVTKNKPIRIKKGSILTFVIPEEAELESISFAITSVTSKDISKEKHCDGHCISWDKEIIMQETNLKELQSVQLKEKGEYVVVLSGLWNLYGDAEHSFYIKVE